MDQKKLLGKKVLYRRGFNLTGYGKVIDQLDDQIKVRVENDEAYSHGYEKEIIARVFVEDIIKVY